MSERKVGIGVKVLIITLLSIFLFIYVANLVAKTLYMETNETMYDKGVVQSMIFYGSYIEIWAVNALSLFTAAGMIGLVAIRALDLKLKYNIIYGTAILSTLITFFGSSHII